MPRHPLRSRRRWAGRLARYAAERRAVSDRMYATTPARFLRRLNLVPAYDPEMWWLVNEHDVLVDAAAERQREAHEDVVSILPRADDLPPSAFANDRAHPDLDPGYRPSPKRSDGETRAVIVAGVPAPAAPAMRTPPAVRHPEVRDARRGSPERMPRPQAESGPSGTSSISESEVVADIKGIPAEEHVELAQVPLSPPDPHTRTEPVESLETSGTIAPLALTRGGDLLESREARERRRPKIPAPAFAPRSADDREAAVDVEDILEVTAPTDATRRTIVAEESLPSIADTPVVAVPSVPGEMAVTRTVASLRVDPAPDAISRTGMYVAPPPGVPAPPFAPRSADDRETADTEVEDISKVTAPTEVTRRTIVAEESLPGMADTPVAMTSVPGEMGVTRAVVSVRVDPASGTIGQRDVYAAARPEIPAPAFAPRSAGDRETADTDVEDISEATATTDVNRRTIVAEDILPPIAALDAAPAPSVDIPRTDLPSAPASAAFASDAAEGNRKPATQAGLPPRMPKRATIEELGAPGPADKTPGSRQQPESIPRRRAQQSEAVPRSTPSEAPGSDKPSRSPSTSSGDPGSDSNLIGDHTPLEWHARLVAVARTEAEARAERAQTTRSSAPDLKASSPRPAPRIEHKASSPAHRMASPRDERLRPSEGARRFLEPLVGLDPADVPIFQGGQSAAITGAFAADAVTVAGAIVLGPQYDAESPRGLGLLAHELTHVARQRQRRFVPPVAMVPTPQPVARFDPGEEQLATRVEARVAALASVAHDVYRGGRSTDVEPSPAATTTGGESQQAAKRSSGEWGGLPAPWEPLPEWLTPAASEPSASGGRSAMPEAPSSPSMAFAAPAAAAAVATDSSLGTVSRAETGRAVSEGPAPTPTGASDADGSKAPAPDIDALARQVFAALKRRLETEIRRERV